MNNKHCHTVFVARYVLALNYTSHYRYIYNQSPCFQVCILEERLCDLSDDCGEGEDEEVMKCRAYHRLNLENDVWLSWFSQDTVDDNFDWIMGSGSTATKGKCVLHFLSTGI